MTASPVESNQPSSVVAASNTPREGNRVYATTYVPATEVQVSDGQQTESIKPHSQSESAKPHSLSQIAKHPLQNGDPTESTVNEHSSQKDIPVSVKTEVNEQKELSRIEAAKSPEDINVKKETVSCSKKSEHSHSFDSEPSTNISHKVPFKAKSNNPLLSPGAKTLSKDMIQMHRKGSTKPTLSPSYQHICSATVAENGTSAKEAAEVPKRELSPGEVSNTYTDGMQRAYYPYGVPVSLER